MAEHEDLFGEISSLIQDHDVRILSKDMNEDQIIDHFLQLSSNDNSFYICCISDVIRQHQRWKTNLPRVTPYFAIKSNPDIVLVKVLAKLGVNFDIATQLEARLAINDVGVEPDRLVYANPIKSISGLRYARSQDIDLIVFDNQNELVKISLYHPGADLLLRIKSDERNSLCQFNSKHGSNLSEVSHLLDLAKTLKMKVVGVSFHVGSNCLDATQYYESIKMVRQAFDIAKEKGLDFNIVNIGGGYQGDLKPIEGKVSFEDTAEQINKALDEFFPDPDIRIIAEPGRFYSAGCMTLVVNIVGKREFIDESGERNLVYYISDSIYKSFSSVIFDYHKPDLISYSERNEKKYKSVVYGNSCDGSDRVGEFELPDLAIGECLICRDMGAYSYASRSQFNYLPDPDIYYYL